MVEPVFVEVEFGNVNITRPGHVTREIEVDAIGVVRSYKREATYYTDDSIELVLTLRFSGSKGDSAKLREIVEIASHSGKLLLGQATPDNLIDNNASEVTTEEVAAETYASKEVW